MKSCRLLFTALGSAVLTACGGNNIIDPRDLVCSIPTDEILSGGVSRDAIPAITRPEVAGANASFMKPDDRVLGVVVNGEARAYPLGILWWHEVVNDTLGGANVLVSYCPLTGSGLAFDPVVGGQLRNFAVSGLLWRTNLIMVDRENESLWNQMLLGSQCGIDRGAVLDRLPIVESDWATWIQDYPGTTVMTVNTGVESRPHFQYPYGSYAEPSNDIVDFVLPNMTWSRELQTKELVLGVFNGSTATAYPLQALAAQGTAVVVNDVVSSTPIVVTYRSEGNVAIAFERVINGQTLTFDVTGEAPFKMVDTETGTEWNGRGEGLAGALSGQQLAPVDDAFVAFWFAWSLYYPDIEIFAF